MGLGNGVWTRARRTKADCAPGGPGRDQIVIDRLLAAALATVLIGGVAACGERPQDINYKQGVYQGKPDTRAWDNEPFKGDQKAWELALKDRAQAQNEYKRTN